MLRHHMLQIAAAVGFVWGTSQAASANQVFSLKFAQRFETVKCPVTAPVGYYCLHVSGESGGNNKDIHFDRSVLFDIKRFDEKHPTCVPDETSGTMYLPQGTLTFRAPGSVCLADGTAAYNLIITGGTGNFRNALGGGRIIVPPPINDNSGSEFWQFELF
jgi:hypothetical protein